MHLTPKVDDVAADKVSQVVNGTGASFTISLSAALKSAARRHWLLSGVTVSVPSAEKVSVFIASNGEAYHPPESNRLQSARQPGGGGNAFAGAGGAKLALVLVAVVLGVLVFRVKFLREPGEGTGQGARRTARAAGGGYRRVGSGAGSGEAAQETEMPERGLRAGVGRGADSAASGDRSSVRRAVAVGNENM